MTANKHLAWTAKFGTHHTGERKQFALCSGAAIVLNPCDREPEGDLAAAFAATGAEVVAAVPTDHAVSDFDVTGRSLMELPDDARALTTVRTLVATLAERRLL